MNSPFEMQSGCNAISSMREALKPIKSNPSVIDIIRKLGDIENSFHACEDFANEASRW